MLNIEKLVKITNYRIQTGAYERERTGIVAYTRTIYKVNRKICCYMEQRGDYKVYLGKPSDVEVLTWTYKTIGEALDKVNSIVAGCLQWYLTIGAVAR